MASSLASLSIKDLKWLIADAGLSCTGCINKEDLCARASEHPDISKVILTPAIAPEEVSRSGPNELRSTLAFFGRSFEGEETELRKRVAALTNVDMILNDGRLEKEIQLWTSNGGPSITREWRARVDAEIIELKMKRANETCLYCRDLLSANVGSREVMYCCGAEVCYKCYVVMLNKTYRTGRAGKSSGNRKKYRCVR